VLDEQGHIREHVNIFVNGTHGEEKTPVADADRVQVLPAITGG
jgi:molybdopterin converting factor small subunit